MIRDIVAIISPRSSTTSISIRHAPALPTEGSVPFSITHGRVLPRPTRSHRQNARSGCPLVKAWSFSGSATGQREEGGWSSERIAGLRRKRPKWPVLFSAKASRCKAPFGVAGTGGAQGFRESLLDRFGESAKARRNRDDRSSPMLKDHAVAEAERIIGEACRHFGIDESILRSRSGGDQINAAVAWAIWRSTTQPQ